MRYALLFPGQGSQAVGMGADLASSYPEARQLFHKANEILGFNLLKLCTEGPEEELRRTINTQPALYVTSCAALAALSSRVELNPFAAAGHSVGEYAAFHAAGAMTFKVGLQLVRRRAELMQEASERKPGTMAAILGLEAAEVREACEHARSIGVVTIANYNCPGQIVISGEQAAVERACEEARSRGARRVVPLQVSGGFHSPLMVTAGDALHAHLRQALFKTPRFPVVVNVAAEYCRSGVDIAPYLTMQVAGSVRWEESMRLLLADGVELFLELGVGEVLSGLLKRIDRGAQALAVTDAPSVERAVRLLSEEPA